MPATPLFFKSIIVDGYRGRHFELKMHGRGKHTVFVMDGNVGKTTTIELLRWCFLFKQSEAINRYRHMWEIPAHVLDDQITGTQTCTITINFEADGIDYSFKRTTVGEYVRDKDERGKVVEDVIDSIKDILEINKGKDVIQDDEVSRFLNYTFRFQECAEYFCFDGEKAREFAQQSSDPGQIHLLLETIHRRSTHPKLMEYSRKLEELKQRVYDASTYRVTNRSLTLLVSTIRREEGEIRETEKELNTDESERRVKEKVKFDYEQEIKGLESKIEATKADNLKKKLEIEGNIKTITSEIENARATIYTNSLNWLSVNVNDAMNQIKNKVREKGKLPDPYHTELITSCLGAKPPTCLICGRELDEESKKRVKALEMMVASHEVDTFLTNPFNIDLKNYNPVENRTEIQKFIEESERLRISLESIKLSQQEIKLIDDINKKRGLLEQLKGEIFTLNGDITTLKLILKEKKDNLTELKKKDESLTCLSANLVCRFEGL